MLPALVFLFSNAAALPQSCHTHNACYSQTNIVAFVRCADRGGTLDEATCCDSFCLTHPGAAGCASCPPPACAADTNYCPLTWGGGRPACTPNECVLASVLGASYGGAGIPGTAAAVGVGGDPGDTNPYICTYGHQRCSPSEPCPCVCAGHEEVDCIAEPSLPPACNDTLVCPVQYGGQAQRCVRDGCISGAGGAHHSFWDVTESCTTDADCSCVCEATGHRCIVDEVVPVVACPEMQCRDEGEAQQCVRQRCIRATPHQQFGHAEFDPSLPCETDADCPCVCATSHNECAPRVAPLQLCSDHVCIGLTGDNADNTTCLYQTCAIPDGMMSGACTACGSACVIDADCPCVCAADTNVRCQLPDPPVCCLVAQTNGIIDCSNATTSECTTLGGTVETVFGGAGQCAEGCNSPLINTPCCWDYTSNDGAIVCQQFQGPCGDGFTANTGDNVYCDETCAPIEACCETRTTEGVIGCEVMASIKCDFLQDVVFYEGPVFESGTTTLTQCNDQCVLSQEVCCYSASSGCLTTATEFDCFQSSGSTDIATHCDVPCATKKGCCAANVGDSRLNGVLETGCDSTENTFYPDADCCAPIVVAAHGVGLCQPCCEITTPSTGSITCERRAESECVSTDDGISASTQLSYCAADCTAITVCCFANDQCSIESQLACETLNGLINPPGCGDNCALPPPPECFVVDDLCALLTQTDCVNLGINCGTPALGQCDEQCQDIPGCCYLGNQPPGELCSSTPQTAGDCRANYGTYVPGRCCDHPACELDCIVPNCCYAARFGGECFPPLIGSTQCPAAGLPATEDQCTQACQPVRGCCHSTTSQVCANDVTLSQCNELGGILAPAQDCCAPDVINPSCDSFCVPNTNVCCYSEDQCLNRDSTLCTTLGGEINSTACDAGCNAKRGCCIADDHCVANLTQAECNHLPYPAAWNPKDCCFPSVLDAPCQDLCFPPQYTCCHYPGGSCANVTISTCNVAQGTNATLDQCDEFCRPVQEPCVAIPATRCGARPGCVGGERDGAECRNLRDCPGSTGCVPLAAACRADAPCFDCDITNATNAVRSCSVCLYCTQEEIDAQAEMLPSERGFACCPTMVGESIVAPVPAESRCDTRAGAPSDCARHYDCYCRVEACDDQANFASQECVPTAAEVCDGALHVQSGTTVSASIMCVEDDITGCARDGSSDYYLIDTGAYRLIIISMPSVFAGLATFEIETAPRNCETADTVMADSILYEGFVEDGHVLYTLFVPEPGLYLVRAEIACNTTFACVSYNFTVSTVPINCPAEVCGQTPCVSSIDCSVDGSCWACDRQFGRCIERQNCTDHSCVAADEPSDTCVGAENGQICRVCNGRLCKFGACYNGACDPRDGASSFDCNCVCDRQCIRSTDCPFPRAGYRRFCDALTGVCVERPLPTQPSSLALNAGLTAECTPAALDASERSYAAHAMDRFGGIDRTTGAHSSALCSAEFAERVVNLGSTAPADLQAPCCAAADGWREHCFAEDEATASARVWLARAWHLMHVAHLRSQETGIESAQKACCASFILAALGAACGRDEDSWSLANVAVVRPSFGPELQAFEDGFGDGDTNDFVLYARTVELRRGEELVALNVHTYPLARGGGFRASYGLAFGAAGVVPSRAPNESVECPERTRRLLAAALNTTDLEARLARIVTPTAGTFAGVSRHAVRSIDGALPVGVEASTCQTLAGTGTRDCPSGDAFVALYADTASALPAVRADASERLASTVAYREAVANTQSGTRYLAPQFGAAATIVLAHGALSPRFVLRNHACGVSVLLGDTVSVPPLAVVIPPSAALSWRWANEGVRLIESPDATTRKCRSGPLSGSERCSNDAVCDGGVCALAPARAGVPYPYANTHFECVARRVDCAAPDADATCCTPEVEQWYLYMTRAANLVYEPLNE